MGGLGSGRHSYASTPAVEDTLHLDADELTDGIEYPGVTGRAVWGDEDAPTAEMTLQYKHPDVDVTAEDVEDPDAVDERATHIQLEYTVGDEYTDSVDEESHSAALEYSDCHFGGVRPWFRCPGVVDGVECGRRVRKLHLPRGGRYWLCRECYDLGYRSSRKSANALDTAELRYRRAFAKADAENRRPHPNNAPFQPTRPKGMHHDTFADLVDAVEDARDEWEKELNKEMRELLEHTEDGDE